jgi:hypothetical protein
VKNKSINSTLVTMCEKGVSGGGVNIKDPVLFYIMECEWGGVTCDFGTTFGI